MSSACGDRSLRKVKCRVRRSSYRRGDGFEKRRLLAEEWAKCCGEVELGPAAVDGDANVVSLRRKSARAA
jgi:hypothetical protein